MSSATPKKKTWALGHSMTQTMWQSFFMMKAHDESTHPLARLPLPLPSHASAAPLAVLTPLIGRRLVRALPARIRRPVVRGNVLRTLRRRDIRRPEPHGLRPLPPQHLQPRRRRKLHCLHDRRLKTRFLLVRAMQAWRGARRRAVLTLRCRHRAELRRVGLLGLP